MQNLHYLSAKLPRIGAKLPRIGAKLPRIGAKLLHLSASTPAQLSGDPRSKVKVSKTMRTTRKNRGS